MAVNQALMSCQFGRMPGGAMRCQIAGTGACYAAVRAEASSRESGIPGSPRPQGEIEAVGHKVDNPVANLEIEADSREACRELIQMRVHKGQRHAQR
ncbi:hypothetical protein D3C72_1405030 [compost metagenome]